MKTLFQIAAVIMMFMAASVQAQTVKKKAPVKKTATKSPAKSQQSVARAAAIAKAKEDSTAAVYALAVKLARQMMVEDSIKKVQVAEQQAIDEKRKQDEYDAINKPTEKKTKEKPPKKVVAKSKVPKSKGKEKKPKPEKVPEAESTPKVAKVKPEKVGGSEAHSWIGLRGMGIASFLVGDVVGPDAKPFIGYGGGLVVNLGLGKHFSIQPEVLYAQQGAKIENEIVKASASANVIQVPLLIKYTFGSNHKGFFINAGPYGNYLINTTNKSELTGLPLTTVTNKPDKTEIAYGVAGGLGFAAPLGKGRLLIEARGTYFLGSNVKGSKASDVRPVTAGLSVGYVFPLGK